MNPSKRIRNDILLTFCLLAVAVIAFFAFKLMQKEGDTVTVTVNGVKTAEYSLSQDFSTEIISGQKGEFKNVLIIKDSKVYISEANCPDKICVNHRKISKSGETIVCLPHKVVVSIKHSDNGETPDIVI